MASGSVVPAVKNQEPREAEALQRSQNGRESSVALRSRRQAALERCDSAEKAKLRDGFDRELSFHAQETGYLRCQATPLACYDSGSRLLLPRERSNDSTTPQEERPCPHILAGELW